SRRKLAKTRSLYSAAKFTCSISIPITSATAAASTTSSLDEQYSLSSSSSQFFMKMPTTSQPWALSRCAVTAESTPPLYPTMTLGLRFICAIIPGDAFPAACTRRTSGRRQPHASSAHPSHAAAPAHVAHGARDRRGDPRSAAVVAAPVLAAAAGDPPCGLPVRQADQSRRPARHQPRHHRATAGYTEPGGKRAGVLEDARDERAAEDHHAVARHDAGENTGAWPACSGVAAARRAAAGG